MTIFIGFDSALRFLLANGLERERSVYGQRFQKLEMTRASPQPDQSLQVRQIQKLGFPDGVGDGPLDVCVANPSARTWTSYVKVHAWKGPDRGTYFSIDNEYCVSTPEAVFMQMASVLSVTHLIELGFLLCGTYVPDSINSVRHSGLRPLSSTALLERYINRCRGMHGVKKARDAMKWIANGSASVMETRLFMLLCLPHRLGGYGFPAAELNKTIFLPEKLASRTVTKECRPDLYWSNYRVALEYDSKKYHDSEMRVIKDKRRANELGSAGVTMFFAGPRDLYDPLALERLAESVSHAMKFRMRFRQRNYLERRFMLHNELLGKSEWDLFKTVS